MRVGKVVPVLAQSFEDMLYKAYEPTSAGIVRFNVAKTERIGRNRTAQAPR